MAPPNRSSAMHRLLVLLTILPLCLAIFAFILQWRGDGDLDDPTGRWPGHHSAGFPGMENSSPSSESVPSSVSTHSHSSDCAEILGGSSKASFPYYRGWKFGFETDPKPKVS
jgi:hypothetical protein